VFADESLSYDKEIAFNAGSHRELLRMVWEDFDELVRPEITKFATKKIGSAAA
jgi:Ala-tRNA(Pro) deacylase